MLGSEREKTPPQCRNYLLSMTMFLFLIVFLIIPSGAFADTATYDATGTWNFVTSNHTNNCGEPNLNETGTLTITQTGNTFTSIDDEGNSISGTVSGTTYTVTGTYPEDGGTTTETITFTLSSSTAGTGRDDWSWTDGSYSCSGGNDFTITKVVTLNAPALSSPADGATGQAANISVTWADTNSSPQESGYKVRIKPSGGSYTEYSAAQNVTSYATSGLSAGVTYYWSVKAVGNGTSTLDSAYPADRAFTVEIANSATYDATGTWNYVTSNHSNNCGDPNTNETGTYIINQTGGSFNASDGVFITYNGTVSGATYTCTFSYPEDGGTTTETLTVTLSSSTSGTGVSNWSWTDGSYSCSGGNDFTITKTGTAIKGDLDGLNGVTLSDAIMALKVVSGLSPGIRENYSNSGTDVNSDGKVGMAEVIYILQKIAAIRTSDLGPTAPDGMVLIPAGSFQMGDNIDNMDWAMPVHTVTVSPFYLDKNEVTKALWDEVYVWATAHGYTFDNAGEGTAANHPVHSISWYDTIKWSNARSEKEGLTPVYYTDVAQTIIYKTGQVNVTNGMVKWSANGYRLPTEAEWEYAARAGTTTRFYTGACISTDQANYNGNYPETGCPAGQISGGTTAVGSFAANPWGLNDMAGNVWEWTWDWYDVYSSSAVTNPKGPDSGSDRVFRGGGCSSGASYCRSADRLPSPPDRRYIVIGFRLFRTQ